MSTRCNIIIKDGPSRIILYHHPDGYPMGVGTELRGYLERIHAWHKGLHSAEHIANYLVKGRIPAPLASTPHDDDEYELTSGLHGDVEYVYVINLRAATLRCYEVTWNEEDHVNYEINWPRVLRRDHLVHIPTFEERDEMIRKYEAEIAARTAAAIR